MMIPVEADFRTIFVTYIEKTTLKTNIDCDRVDLIRCALSVSRKSTDLMADSVFEQCVTNYEAVEIAESHNPPTTIVVVAVPKTIFSIASTPIQLSIQITHCHHNVNITIGRFARVSFLKSSYIAYRQNVKPLSLKLKSSSSLHNPEPNRRRWKHKVIVRIVPTKPTRHRSRLPEMHFSSAHNFPRL